MSTNETSAKPGLMRNRVEVEAAMRRASEHAQVVADMADQCYAGNPDWGVERQTWIHVSEAALVLTQYLDRAANEMRRQTAAKKGGE